MSLLQKIFREPLVHFLLIGAAIFMVFAAVAEPDADIGSGKRVAITEGQIEQIVAQFRETWRRPPTRDELDAMVQNQVREDILVQEALELSMDSGDPIIRRRLAQKMQFLLESAAGARVASEEDLRAHYDATKSEYASETLIAFEQVYVGDVPETADLTQVLAALDAGANPGSVGQRTLLPATMELSGLRAVNSVFGTGFFETLLQADAGTWIAPVRSGFGVHAVRVTDRRAGAVPEFEAVRDRVESDWKAVQAEELSEAVYSEMRAQYDVTLPDETAFEGVLE